MFNWRKDSGMTGVLNVLRQVGSGELHLPTFLWFLSPNSWHKVFIKSLKNDELSGKACWYDFLKKNLKMIFLKKRGVKHQDIRIVLFQSTQENVNYAPMWTKPAVRRAFCLLLNAAFQLESTKSMASVFHVYHGNSPRGHFFPSSCLRS